MSFGQIRNAKVVDDFIRDAVHGKELPRLVREDAVSRQPQLIPDIFGRLALTSQRTRLTFEVDDGPMSL